MESIKYLEKDVYDILEKHGGKDSILSYEGFYVGYPNSVKFVKGTLLRQNALIAKERLRVATMRLNNGSGAKGEKEAAERDFMKAREEFCEFLNTAEHAD